MSAGERRDARDEFLGLMGENQVLKTRLLESQKLAIDCKEVIRQLELGMLVLCARLVVCRFGSMLEQPFNESPLEQGGRAVGYQDSTAIIRMSKVTRGLAVMNATTGKVVVSACVDGSLESLDPDFNAMRHHLRAIENGY